MTHSSASSPSANGAPSPSRYLIGELDLPLVRPESSEALARYVREAAATGTAVYPVGGGTRNDLGRCPDKPGTAVDLRSLAQVIDYPSADMTITVQTGITIAKLGEILAAKGQRLPVDSHDPANETLGGLIAANGSGPRRFGHGTMRDYVIGIKYLTDETEEAKAGGRVVKNVAGYDLCKLHTGALGTLGIITEVTLKLRPLSEARAVVLVSCPGDKLEELAALIHGSRTRPVSVDALNADACSFLTGRGVPLSGLAAPTAGNWLVGVGFEENRGAIDWQKSELVKELNGYSTALLAEGQEEGWWSGLTALCPGTSGTVMKSTSLPSKMVPILDQAQTFTEVDAIVAHLGNGIARVHTAPSAEVGQAAQISAKLRKLALEAGGNLVLERAGAAFRKTIPVWGEPRPDHDLARRIHRELDPHGLFNPGRFLPGI